MSLETFAWLAVTAMGASILLECAWWADRDREDGRSWLLTRWWVAMQSALVDGWWAMVDAMERQAGPMPFRRPASGPVISAARQAPMPVLVPGPGVHVQDDETGARS